MSDNWKNKLICGDNLEILSTLDKESVDLIYIDPPFFSNRNYEIIWGDEAEVRAFVDRWEGGIEVYINWMRERVRELYRVLKPTGTFYLHCDWHASHYLKVMCDEIFGRNNFRNEIVWCYSGGGRPQKDFARKHDVILRYSKTENYNFYADQIRISYNLDVSKYTSEKAWGSHKGTNKVYKPNPEGKVPEDWWEISPINSQSKERLGYPTQKPETLLRRIIEASSKNNDIVLDAFCGCGTAMAVAQMLGRRWIGIDISPSAIALIKTRKLAPLGVSEKDILIIGMPKKVDDLHKFEHFEFQYWVVNEMRGEGSTKKVGDLGIDGISFFHHYPIQVKQSEGVGREVVDNFETAIRRYYSNYSNNYKDRKGILVAFSFTKGAKEETARVRHKEGIEIHLLTVQNILDKKFDRPQEIAVQSLF